MGEFSEKQKEIVNYLRLIGRGDIEPAYSGTGICTNLSEKFCYCVDVGVFGGWSKFSGYYAYPIPSTEHGLSSDEIYSRRAGMWSGSYGDLRKELCLWLADYYERNGI